LASDVASFVSWEFFLVQTVETVMAVFFDKELPRAVAGADRVVGEGAGHGDWWGWGGVFLASHVEGSGASAIIRATGPGMVDKVDIDDLSSSTGGVLVASGGAGVTEPGSLALGVHPQLALAGALTNGAVRVGAVSTATLCVELAGAGTA